MIAASHCQCIGSQSVTVRQLLPRSLLGSGQVEQLGQWMEAKEAEVAFVDHQLSPVQQRNLETAWGVKVVDRTG
ncbi:MAG: GTPase HflX, partial [Mariprofundaceae bacterium]|nr:GTPase HflX [Mariprofundaceae bacterium]